MHLDIFVASNSKCIVISCATCLKSTLKAWYLIPPKRNNVCDEWTKCYAIFYKDFEDIGEDFSRKKLINYLYFCDKRLLMCNACKSNFIFYLKDFLVPFILDEHLLFCKEFEKKFGHFKKYKIKNRQQLSPETFNFYRHRFQRFSMKLAFTLKLICLV